MSLFNCPYSIRVLVGTIDILVLDDVLEVRRERGRRKMRKNNKKKLLP